jgi:hypothetical protein
MPGYRKPAHGVLVAREIALGAMRAIVRILMAG